MDLRDRGRRRIARIQFVGQPVDRHDPVGVQEQDRQNGALTRTAKADRAKSGPTASSGPRMRNSRCTGRDG